MSAVTLGIASAGDAAQLAGLHAGSFPEGWDAAAIVSLLAAPGMHALTARHAGNLAGFVMLRVAADEAEILTLAVSPELRRQHIAQRLMVFAAAQASVAGARSLFLEVASDNNAALALYRSLSFEDAGRRANYYRRGTDYVDALVLRLDLTALTA